jgi:hypothetical protein
VHIVVEGDNIGEVPVDGGDPWRGVDDSVVVEVGVVGEAYDGESSMMGSWKRDLVSTARGVS